MSTINKYEIDSYRLEQAQLEDLEQLLNVCRINIGSLDEKQIIKAFTLCYLSHNGVTRASGEPYYYHPVEVAKIVAQEINIDDTSVIAALLFNLLNVSIRKVDLLLQCSKSNDWI